MVACFHDCLFSFHLSCCNGTEGTYKAFCLWCCKGTKGACKCLFNGSGVKQECANNFLDVFDLLCSEGILCWLMAFVCVGHIWLRCSNVESAVAIARAAVGIWWGLCECRLALPSILSFLCNPMFILKNSIASQSTKWDSLIFVFKVIHH